MTITGKRAVATAAAVMALLLSACGTDDSEGEAPTGGRGYPLTIENCGAEVTFGQAPTKGVLLKPAAATFLHEIGVLGTAISARAGAYSRDYYDDATWAEIESIPVLSDDIDSSGHLQISKEIVLAQQPDVVLGSSDNLNRDTLGAAGVPLLEEPALCPEPPAKPSFAAISEQMMSYGRVFDAQDEATAAVERLDAQLAAVLEKVDPAERRTAAVLYPTVGGGAPYAYGARSMAAPQLEAAGFTNVFADVDERVFEVTTEELVGRDPDILILLHSDGDPADVKAAVAGMNGARALTAVREDQILVQLFNFTEPPSPLAVDGLERIVEAFQP